MAVSRCHRGTARSNRPTARRHRRASMMGNVGLTVLAPAGHRPRRWQRPLDAISAASSAGAPMASRQNKERIMRWLWRGGLALVLVMAALPPGDRPAHAADSILTEILRRGTVRIAVAVAAPPLRFEDENGNLQGYEIDIANRLAKDLGVTIDWIKTNAT